MTSDVPARLAAHNDGRSPHTAPLRPWRLDVVLEFTDERRAIAFERHLKSGFGFVARNALDRPIHSHLVFEPSRRRLGSS